MKNRKKKLLEDSLYYLGLILFSFLLLKFVVQRTDVIGQSMMPCLNDGDSLMMDKISYRFGEPERFDIVVFPFRNHSGKNYIKRIIALPGETIRIDEDGTIYVNGEVLEENFGREVIRQAGNAASEITLDDHHYFVMGDNRNNSDDSRFNEVGLVSREEIIGKAWLRIWPMSDFGKLE